jgi:phosphate-selective porin OprO/OprP
LSKLTLSLGAAVAMATVVAVPAHAQSAAAASAQASAPAAPAAQPTAGWQDGIFVQSADGNNRLQFNVLIQADGRFTTDSPAAFVDTFSIRRVRPYLQGRVAKYFDFRLTPDFGNGAVAIQDAYFDTRFSSAFRVRIGKDKTPVGLELLYSDPGLFFPERSLVSSLVPNRDDGVQVQGDLAAGKVSYALGVFNGVPDGGSSSTEIDTNSGKDVAGRILLQPFRSSKTPASALNNLYFHIGFSTGNQTGALPSFKTSVGQTFFSYNGAAADGQRVRVSPAVAYFYKRGGVFLEYARTSQDISKSAVKDTIDNDGWDINAVWNLTGENASSGVIRPKKVFDPSAGHWGAAQLVARYAELRVDHAAFDDGFASATSNQKAQQASVGVNWYPIQFIKYYLEYEHTSFKGGPTARPAENTIFLRAQVSF